MRFASLLILGVTAAAAGAQGPSVRVTYFTRAARVGVAVRELGRMVRVDLQASPKIDGEVVVIDVKNQPLSEVMSRIATVTSGEWKQTGTGFRLQPDLKVRTKEERQELAQRAAEIRKTIIAQDVGERKRLKEWEKVQAYMDSENGKAPPMKRDAKSTVALNSLISTFMPLFPENVGTEDLSLGAITITRLLKCIDPLALARIGVGDKFVFSDKPNTMQRTLGPGAAEILEDLVRQYNTDPPSADSAETVMVGGRTLKNVLPGHIGPISKAILSVSTYKPEMDVVGVKLVLYDEKGNSVFHKSKSKPIFGTTFYDENEEANRVAATKSKGSEENSKVEYSADTQALIRGEFGRFLNMRQALPANLRHKLFHPELFDPLSFIQTDEILSFAKKLGKPLVADISDDWSVGDNSVLDPSDVELAAVIEDLEEGETMHEVADGVFTVLMPSSPSEARACRLDRFALAKLLNSVEARGLPSLDDIGAFACACPYSAIQNSCVDYLEHFVPITKDENDDIDLLTWTTMRFYSSLSADDRSRLVNGGRIYFRSLSEPSRSELENLVYGSDCNLLVDDPHHYPEEVRGQFGEQDYRDEPTEVAPDGLPNDGYIELQISKEPIAFPLDRLAVEFSQRGVLDSKDLAALEASEPVPVIGRVSIGERSNLRFTFHLTSQVSLKTSLEDNHLPNRAPIVTYSNLPPGFRKRIADQKPIQPDGGA